MTSSTTWRQDLEKTASRFYKNKAKTANWAGVLGVRTLEANAKEQQRNQEAESSWVRKTLWGATDQPTSTGTETENMGHTILGDIVVPQPQQSNVPAIAAMATMLGLGALGTYLLTRNDAPQPPAVVTPEFDDSSVQLGLGRIEDYQGATK